MEFDSLRRYSKEFSDLQAEIYQLPKDIKDFSKNLACNLNMPELTEPFENYLLRISSFPKLQGIALIIDAWERDGIERTPEASLYCYFLENIGISELEDNPEPMPHLYLNDINRLLYTREDRNVRIHCYYILTAKLGLEASIEGLIRQTFEKDPGPFRANRIEEKPPSGFVIALINQDSVTLLPQ